MNIKDYYPNSNIIETDKNYIINHDVYDILYTKIKHYKIDNKIKITYFCKVDDEKLYSEKFIINDQLTNKVKNCTKTAVELYSFKIANILYENSDDLFKKRIKINYIDKKFNNTLINRIKNA